MGAALLRPDGQLRGTKKKTKRNHKRVRNKINQNQTKSSLVRLVLLGGSQAGLDGLDLKDEGENDEIHQKNMKRLQVPIKKSPLYFALSKISALSSSLSKERLSTAKKG